MLLGISSNGVTSKLGYDAGFALIRKCGFDAVDISLESYGKKDSTDDIYRTSEDQFTEYFENIRNLAGKYDLVISQTHGRCTTYTPDEKQQEYARWVSERDLKATSILGAPGCVIHQIASGKWPDNYADDDFMHAKNKSFFDWLAPYAEAYNVLFSLETFGRATLRGERIADHWADIRLLRDQFDMLDTQNKAICVDTGHTNEAMPFGMPSPAEAIRMLGDRVKFLHLHDNNGTYDQHLPPLMGGLGSVYWPDVFDALDEIGYTGVYNFELGLTKYYYALPEAMVFLGKFLRRFIDDRGQAMNR